MLKKSFVASLEIKIKINPVASVRTIRGYIKKLSWTNVRTKYCQIVSTNILKRFIYAC